MSATNPLAAVHTALWKLLTDNAAFRALVPTGCRIKNVGTATAGEKRAAQAADFPATLIEPVDGLAVADWTNTDGHIKKRFRVKVATGNRQIDDAMELEWVVFCAMSAWETTMTALSWRGHTGYVKHVGIYEHEETLKERDLTRLETGWATVWDGEVWMFFARTDIVVGPG